MIKAKIMQAIISILMHRDSSLSKQDAIDMIDECREQIVEKPMRYAEIIADCLGLEPDYLFDIME